MRKSQLFKLHKLDGFEDTWKRIFTKESADHLESSAGNEVEALQPPYGTGGA
jgi:hypothetical protein